MKTRNTQKRIMFAYEASARDVLQKAKSIAKDYGRVTLADVHELIGNTGRYEDTKIYWTPALLDTEVAVYVTPNNDWCLHFFDYLTDEPEDETEDDTTELHPIYINVTTSDMDDSDCILCSVLAHAQKISDRDIFINVY